MKQPELLAAVMGVADCKNDREVLVKTPEDKWKAVHPVPRNEKTDAAVQ